MAGLGKDREASGATAAGSNAGSSTPTSSTGTPTSTGTPVTSTSSTSGSSSLTPTTSTHGETGEVVTEREVVHEQDSGDYERGLQRGREEGLREGYRAVDPDAEQRRKDAYGGLNLGASFFGWLVAVALTILLTGILSAVATGIGDASNLDISTAELRSDAGTVGLVTGIVLLVVLMIGYYAGGYVAGRMSRFDGVKQGIGVWVIGLLVTIVVAVITAVAGSEYDVFRYIPSIPIPTDTLTSSGLIALGAVLLGTLLAAIIGGKVGQRYHTKVDRIS
ncbi:MAG: hypothetical protein AVDCRST_MAG21-1342 [uncultured Nocardioidaceae bacterium]|uniref:Uncharacterized protein n=1 Tax=uncultured Nocardioidaceae bacterium TaxID=253824 RepID=A0A6J4N4D2_9ACTN|nr:MAG: hypothetical protein AVDCRST_MAG21-1342 [uncultured Nocardioidaceae bacterium]